MFAKEIYTSRRERLRSILSSGIVLLPGNSEASANYPDNCYRFRQDSTFLYFFGLNVPDLAATIDIDSGVDTIYGDDFSMDDIIWMGTQPTVAELGSRCGVERTSAAARLKEVLAEALHQGRRIHILPPYRAENRLKINSLLGIKNCAVDNYVSLELSKAVVAMRSIKSLEEIDQIDRACDIGYRMHTEAMRLCRAGNTERQIAGAIEGIALQYGAGVSFHSIVSQHGETLHNHSHDGVLAEGRLLLCDAGAENTMNYCSDFTRTIPVGGKFSARQADIYNIVLAANECAARMAAPGILYRDVHIAAVQTIVEGLKSVGLMRGNAQDAVAAGAHALLMPHGLGHMMGLDVHDMEDIGENLVGYDDETPRGNIFGISNLRMGRRLQTGMVLTDEPGIYFIPAYIAKWRAEHKCAEFIDFDALDAYLSFGGIRIEDDLLIIAGGNRRLGERRVPASVAEVEAYMAENI